MGTLIYDTKVFIVEAVVQRCSVKGLLRNFAKLTGKHLCHSLIFKKVAV